MPGRRVSRESTARGGRAADLEPEQDPETAAEDTARPNDRADPNDGQVKSRPPAAAVAQAAIQAIAELIGRQPEGVTALEPTEDGWRVAVEVVEDQRVPSSADILATYQAELDMEANLLSYRRTKRYQRGRADSGEGT